MAENLPANVEDMGLIVWDDSTFHRATKSEHHNYSVYVLEPML